MRVLWNKETDKRVVEGDLLKSFRDEAWQIRSWNTASKKVFAANMETGFKQEFYHTVFPALEWREEACV